jgi:hypothetical protein
MLANSALHKSGSAVRLAPEVRRGNAGLGAKIKEAEEASRLCSASHAAVHVKRHTSGDWSFYSMRRLYPKIGAYYLHYAWSMHQS